MTTMRIVLVVVILIIIAIALFLNYTGFFAKPVVQEKNVGPFVLVYEEHMGDYRGTKVAQDKVYDILLDTYKIETYKGFGIYYDDPKEVPKDELRSIAGCILEESDYKSIDVLKEKGLKIKEIKNQKSIVAEFPLKNPLSILAGIKRVHPELEAFAKDKGIKNRIIMEIYDIPNKNIIYVLSENL